MWWMILILVLLLLTGMLFLPVSIRVDTRVPVLQIRWSFIGGLSIWFDDEWRLGLNLFFLKYQYRINELKKKSTSKRREGAARKRSFANKWKKRVWPMIKSFQVKEWKVAMDTHDYVKNAQLYPLNFLPVLQGHVMINFRNENYLLLNIRNTPWKLIWRILA